MNLWKPNRWPTLNKEVYRGANAHTNIDGHFLTAQNVNCSASKSSILASWETNHLSTCKHTNLRQQTQNNTRYDFPHVRVPQILSPVGKKHWRPRGRQKRIESFKLLYNRFLCSTHILFQGWSVAKARNLGLRLWSFDHPIFTNHPIWSSPFIRQSHFQQPIDQPFGQLVLAW